MKKHLKKLFSHRISFSIVAFFISGLLFFLFQSRTAKNNNQTNQLDKSLKSTTNSAQLIDYIIITETPIPTPTQKPTPTPTRTPTPIPIKSSELETWFTQYSNMQSIDKELLKRIAYCESKFNPQATNGIYAGLFQFSISSWISTRRMMNANQDPNLRFNPEESIKTAAFKIATSGVHAWPNCNK